MAIPYQLSLSHIFLSCLLAFRCFSKPALCFKHKHLNLSTMAIHWSVAGATWYGCPTGAGSNGGACGYGDKVSQPPFSSMITAISPSLYQSGKECGACYQIKCTTHPSCSGKPVRVITTDLCPGGPCASNSKHFDLSGTAFGAMANPGQDDKLRAAGVLQIKYVRVACYYPGKTITFHVDQGSNPNYFAAVVEFVDGDGNLARVDLKESSSKTYNGWRTMQHSWGAVWMLNSVLTLEPPFSIRLTLQYSRQTLVARDVIPDGWQPGATYRSLVNYL